jgi:hypothetical protein
MLSDATFVLLLFALCGGPVLLVDWFRRRRQKEITRQIALTDAIDGRIGSIVAPVVTKPLFGPWEIQIAVPLHQSAMVARILSVVNEVFPSFEGTDSRPYRIFLSAKAESPRQRRASRRPRSATRWARNPIGAA